MPGRTRRRAALLVLIAATAVRAGAQPATPDWEWLTRGADLANTRYAPLDQIDAANFESLELAWRFGTHNLGPRPDYRWQTTPLVADGVMYTTAGSRRAVVAIDAASGELLWVHRMDEGRRGELATRGGSGRGVAYWTDGGRQRIFYITPGYRLVALDAHGRADPLLRRRGHRRSAAGDGSAARPRDRRRVAANAAGRCRKHHHRGRFARAGPGAAEPIGPEGSRARLRRADGRTALDLPHDSGRRRVRRRHLAE